MRTGPLPAEAQSASWSKRKCRWGGLFACHVCSSGSSQHALYMQSKEQKWGVVFPETRAVQRPEAQGDGPYSELLPLSAPLPHVLIQPLASMV